MTADPSLERRVTRLENDNAGLYDIVTGISRHLKRHDKRFTAIEGRLDGLETRLDGLETRFDGLETRFDGLETTLVEVLRRLPEPPSA